MNYSYRSNLWKAYAFKLLISMHFFSGVLIPFFTQWGGISFAQVMILQSIFLASVFLLEIPTGTVADRFGRKYSLVLGAIVNVAGVSLYVLYPNFWIFALAEVVWAASGALISGAGEAFVYDTLKELGEEKTSKKIFATMDSYYLVGIMVAAPIGSLLAAKFGLTAPMIVTTIPLFLAFLLGLTFKEPQFAREKESYFETMKKGVKHLKGHKALQILALDSIVISAVAYYMIWLYQKVLENLAIDITWFGFVHAAITIGELIVLNNYIQMEKWLGSKKLVLFISGLIPGIGFLIVGFSQTAFLSIAAIIITVAFGFTRQTPLNSYMNKYIKSEQRATTMSTISMARKGMFLVFNPLIGFAADISLQNTLIGIGIATTIFAIFSRIEEEHLID